LLNDFVLELPPPLNKLCLILLIIYQMSFKKKNVRGIFFDLQKAFDCVNHDILLNKLEFYGITGRFFQLLKTYLQGRYQRVVLNNNHFTSISDCGEITHGVPQGSILGPFAFPPIYK
jgi:hypothetical protein